MTKKDKAKELWNHCFTDGKAFTELYFQKRYTDENTLSLTKGEQMIAMLQLLPYPFQFLNKQVDTAYISGACTHPEYRQQGAMRKLLTQSLEHLQKSEIPICTLIPAEEWLFGYYQKSGFETIFYNSTYSIDVPKYKHESNVVVTFNHTFNQDSYDYLHKKWMKKKAAILHPVTDFEVILADLQLAEGQVFTAHIKNEVVGVAIAYYNPEDKKIHVNELASRDICINQELFEAMSKYFSTNELVVIAPPYDDKKRKLGMLRIIQAKEILTLFAESKPLWETDFYLKDPILVNNQGAYQVKEGKLTYTQRDKRTTDKLVSINDLASLLFEPLDPYMSLMLN